MHPPNPEMRNPATGQGDRGIANANFNTTNNATTETADQPETDETALAAAFRDAARRKAVQP
jgi:hypothetical protein